MQAIKILLEGCTYREAAARLDVSERTLWRWRRQVAFQRALHRSMLETFNASGGQGLSLLPEIISTLKEIMRSPAASNSDRIAASKVLITSANEYQIRKQLEAQIFELESRLIKLSKLGAIDVGSAAVGAEGEAPEGADGEGYDLDFPVIGDDPFALGGEAAAEPPEDASPPPGDAAAQRPFGGPHCEAATDVGVYVLGVEDPDYRPSAGRDNGRELPLVPGQQGIDDPGVLDEAAEWIRTLTQDA